MPGKAEHADDRRGAGLNRGWGPVLVAAVLGAGAVTASATPPSLAQPSVPTPSVPVPLPSLPQLPVSPAPPVPLPAPAPVLPAAPPVPIQVPAAPQPPAAGTTGARALGQALGSATSEVASAPAQLASGRSQGAAGGSQGRPGGWKRGERTHVRRLKRELRAYRGCFSVLPRRSQRILQLHLGLHPARRAHSREAIARRYETSTRAIARNEHRSVVRLRRASRSGACDGGFGPGTGAGGSSGSMFSVAWTGTESPAKGDDKVVVAGVEEVGRRQGRLGRTKEARPDSRRRRLRQQHRGRPTGRGGHRHRTLRCSDRSRIARAPPQGSPRASRLDEALRALFVARARARRMCKDSHVSRVDRLPHGEPDRTLI